MSTPYKSTPRFNEETLPDAIRTAHSTKAGVWGVLVVEAGSVRLIFHEPRQVLTVSPGSPATIPPEALHHVETDGPMIMYVDFYRGKP
ncbi:hypothetical protein GCM10011371_34980 [Novosphingobium marinum]|uniref:Tellurite resistance-related uncharacterized protein n=1 Tax=Novosphingobium marinum TaxID=1514948 RepID=A0A7Y9XZ25_9SPHN|nr:DUF1971 domain-containing protein [Novosphingobium marinum]NYH97202.1 tellurite resistance-related uncharacterized protein [Novosphingobium marinum]GGC44580.1 hypothetical protein GCM10011371_34980 [Novosphingobium marinum]